MTDLISREMNFSTQIKQSNTDEWYTPKESVEMIVPYLIKAGYKKILCPFDKRESNFNVVLSENGFDVTFSHIEDGTDFFNIQNLNEYDAIVSNPPFSKRQKILERLFESEVPFAMIMNFNGLFDSKKDGNCSEIMILNCWFHLDGCIFSIMSARVILRIFNQYGYAKE